MEAFYVLFGFTKEMAWLATPVILLVLLARIVLERGFGKTYYFIWGIVALRLICPVFPTSDISIFRYVEEPMQVILQLQAEDVTGGRYPGTAANENTWGSARTSEKENDLKETAAAEETTASETPAVSAGSGRNLFQKAGLIIWLTGVLMMLCYAFLSGIVLKRRLRYATCLYENILECDVVDSPFVFGVIRPKIYIPYHLTKQELNYILAHERCHIRRRDYLTKWLAFLLLAVYWFHPLVWAAYILFNRDMEASCDACVLKGCSLPERKAYGRILLRFSGEKKVYGVTEIGFGERSMKKRMKHILSGKKTTIGATVAAVIFLAVLAMSCLTDSRVEKPDEMTAGQALYEAVNPYIGDAPANAKLLETIAAYVGEPESEYTMELQTEEVPYVLTLQFEKAPNPDEMCKAAILFLALTENCEQVCWEYTPDEEENLKYTQMLYPQEEMLPEAKEPEKLLCYLKLSDAQKLLDVDDIKAYAASPEKIEELLEMVETRENQSFFAYHVMFDYGQGNDMIVTSNFYDL